MMKYWQLQSVIVLVAISGASCNQKSPEEKRICAFRQCERRILAERNIPYQCGSLLETMPNMLKITEIIQRPDGVSHTRWKEILNKGDVIGYTTACGPNNERCDEKTTMYKSMSIITELSNQCVKPALQGDPIEIGKFMKLSAELNIRCNAGDQGACAAFCCHNGMDDSEEIPCAEPCDEEYAEFIETLKAQKKQLQALTRKANCSEVTAMSLTCGTSFIYLPTMSTLSWEWQVKDDAYGEKIWKLALFAMASKLSTLPPFNELDASINIDELSDFIAGINNVYGLTSSKTFRDLLPEEAKTVMEKLASFYTQKMQSVKDPFTQKIVFKKSTSVTYAASINRISNILTATTIALDAFDALSDKEKLEKIAKSPKTLLILDWLHSVLTESNINTPGLAQALADWKSIPNVAINEAHNEFAKEIIKISAMGIVAINSTSIVSALLSYMGAGSIGGIGGALIGLAIGICVEASFVAADEIADYPLYFQMAALLYSIALTSAAEQEAAEINADIPLLIVNFLAIETANSMMDEHVVGKIFPKMAYQSLPFNNPLSVSPFAVAAFSVIMPEQEKSWQEFLDDYYRRSRFIIVWHSRGSVLLDYLLYYLECLQESSE